MAGLVFTCLETNNLAGLVSPSSPQATRDRPKRTKEHSKVFMAQANSISWALLWPTCKCQSVTF